MSVTASQHIVIGDPNGGPPMADIDLTAAKVTIKPGFTPENVVEAYVKAIAKACNR